MVYACEIAVPYFFVRRLLGTGEMLVESVVCCWLHDSQQRHNADLITHYNVIMPTTTQNRPFASSSRLIHLGRVGGLVLAAN